MNDPRDYSEMRLSGAAFDRLPEGPPRLRYAICAAPRTGSFLLCRLLIRLGLGVPHEYFNDLHRDLLCARWSVGYDGYPAALEARRTANGVFGMKLQWGELVRNYQLDESELAGRFRLIHLFRRDRVRQGVSYHLAQLTGQWGDDDVVTTPPLGVLDKSSPDGVAAQIALLTAEDDAWRGLFARTGAALLAVAYEDLVSDRPGTLRAILDHLGIDGRDRDLNVPQEAPAPPHLQRQALSERIAADYRSQGGRG